MNDWIEVTDRLPTERHILIYGTPTCGTCGSKKRVTQGRFIDGYFEFGEYDCGIDATHWMPLPQEPKDA